MHPLYLAMDPYLIWLYRLSGLSFVDFLLGTFILAFVCKIVGEFTISIIFLINRKHIDDTNDEMLRYRDLSMEALKAGDKTAYTACNKMANEAFGKSFFMQMALGASSMWPVFFALLWMNCRFSEVEFPLAGTDWSVGYLCVFIALYAAAHLIFKKIKYKLPYFRRIKPILDSYNTKAA